MAVAYGKKENNKQVLTAKHGRTEEPDYKTLKGKAKLTYTLLTHIIYVI
jgi:hypothetical protein